MANRSPDRYMLPKPFENRDLTLWLAGKPFFLASAIKHSFRGWNDADDLRKALGDIGRSRLHEFNYGDIRMELMWFDLRFFHTKHETSYKSSHEFMDLMRTFCMEGRAILANMDTAAMFIEQRLAQLGESEDEL